MNSVAFKGVYKVTLPNVKEAKDEKEKAAYTEAVMNTVVMGANASVAEPKFDNDLFVSLGTFVYLDNAEQAAKLKEISTQFKNMFIELDKPNAVQQDKELVNNLGAEYNAGFSRQELAKILGTQIPFELKEIGGRVKNARVAQALKAATEQFLVR